MAFLKDILAALLGGQSAPACCSNMAIEEVDESAQADGSAEGSQPAAVLNDGSAATAIAGGQSQRRASQESAP